MVICLLHEINREEREKRKKTEESEKRRERSFRREETETGEVYRAIAERIDREGDRQRRNR